MGELLPLGTRSAFWRCLLDLDSAIVRSAGSRAGDGETLRGEVFSLNGEGDADIVRSLFLCLDLFFFFLCEDEEELESSSMLPTGASLVPVSSCKWRAYVSISAAKRVSLPVSDRPDL